MSALGTIGLAGAGSGLVGAAAGAYAGAVSYYEPNPSAGYTTMNAAIGAAAGVGTAALAYGIGSAAVYAGGKAFADREAVMDFVSDKLESLGDKGIRTGIAAGKTAAAGLRELGTVGAGVGDYVGEAMLHKLSEEEIAKEAGSRMFGHKLSGKGKLIMAGVIAGSALMGGLRQYNEDRLGTPAGFMTSTPVTEQMDDKAYKMAENYAAGGDLVFALNTNRRG